MKQRREAYEGGERERDKLRADGLTEVTAQREKTILSRSMITVFVVVIKTWLLRKNSGMTKREMLCWAGLLPKE